MRDVAEAAVERNLETVRDAAMASIGEGRRNQEESDVRVRVNVEGLGRRVML